MHKLLNFIRIRVSMFNILLTNNLHPGSRHAITKIITRFFIELFTSLKLRGL
jgi:hypothetical protein